MSKLKILVLKQKDHAGLRTLAGLFSGWYNPKKRSSGSRMEHAGQAVILDPMAPALLRFQQNHINLELSRNLCEK